MVRRLTTTVVVVALIVGLLGSVPTVQGHGNAVEADAQWVMNGTVHLEFVSLVTDGYVVLHRDEGGEPGAVIGYRDPGDGAVFPNLTVAIDPAVRANLTAEQQIWAVLHYDTGDGEFDPADDPPAATTADGPIAATRFPITPSSEGAAWVVAERDHVPGTNTSQVAIRGVALPSTGYVVVKADENGTAGQVVGQTAVGPGVHHEVVVDLDTEFYHRQPEQFRLWVELYHDDGDGVFDVEVDESITVGQTSVTSDFLVRRTGNITTPTSESSEHDHEASHDHPETPTTQMDDATERTITESREPSPTLSSVPTDDSTSEASPSEIAGTTGQPGFGPLAAIIALACWLLVTRRR